MVTKKDVVVAVAVVVAAWALGGYYYYITHRKKPSTVDLLAKSQGKTVEEMVSNLQKLKIIKDSRVADTMLKVDRAKYVPVTCKNPYKEIAVPIGFNATISAPHMHALGLDILSSHIRSGSSVLDVGCGSGYVSACLAHMVGVTGKVIGIDHIPELVEQAKANIIKANPSLYPLIVLETADGFQGVPAHAPYDAIYVGAASEYIPEELIQQLKPNGRLLIPVGPPSGFHSLVIVDKNLDGTIKTTNMGTVRFVPLTSYENQLGDSEPGMTKVIQQDGDSILLRTQFHPAPDSSPAEIKILKRG